MYRKNTNLRYLSYMIHNYTIDLCAQFGGTLSSPFADIFTNEFKKYSNIFHPCPFTVNTMELILIKY